MINLSAASFTTKPDCRLTRVATMRIERVEMHFCVTCRATLFTEIGARAECPARRLLAFQRTRAANDETLQSGGAA